MDSAPTAAVGWREVLNAAHLAPLAVLCLGVWLHAADATLVATVMPSAVAEIGGAALVAWTFALYLLGAIVAGAGAGLLALRFGLRAAMAGAALLYAFGCGLSAVAPEFVTMLAGRLLQGLGGGCMLALAFVGVDQFFPPRLGPRIIAAISAVWGASTFLGPLVGGAFAELGLWRFGFWAFAGQAVLLALAIRLLLPPRAVAAPAQRPPVGRLALFTAGVLLIAVAGVEVSPAVSPPLILLGLALLAVFFRRDAGAGADRLFPRTALSLTQPTGAGFVFVLSFSIATIAFTIYGPLLMRLLLDAGPLLAGYMVASESIAWSVAAVAVAGVGVAGEPRAIRAGAVAMTAGIAGLALAVPYGPLWSYLPFLLLLGGGFGLAYAFVLRRVVAHAGADDRERAAAGLPTMQMIGYAVGAAASGVVGNAAGFGAAVDPQAAVAVGFWIFAAFLPVAALGLVAAWRIGDAPGHT